MDMARTLQLIVRASGRIEADDHARKLTEGYPRFMFVCYTADMGAGRVVSSEIRFFLICDGGVLVGMGAFKRIDGGHAEIKSMCAVVKD